MSKQLLTYRGNYNNTSTCQLISITNIVYQTIPYNATPN